MAQAKTTRSRAAQKTAISTGQPRTLGRQAPKTLLAREKIINAVIALIKEGGYANATSSRIDERAGMTWGAAQHHFGAKEDILQADRKRVVSGKRMSVRVISGGR